MARITKTDKPKPNPTIPPAEDDEARAVRMDAEADAPKKAEAVPNPAAPDNNLEVHVTKPLEQSLAKLKARRVPHKYPGRVKKGERNAESEDRTKRPADADGVGRSRHLDGHGFTILPIDWFRKP